MKQLILSSSAYRTLVRDRQADKLSHAYMLHFNDARELKAAAELFALAFFNLTEGDADGKRLLAGNLPDCAFYPADGKRWTADAAAEIVEDSSLRPLEREKKLYVLCSFEQASPIVQNKLLKVLEEPPAGVHFLVCATSLSPVLDTVKSRVKTLTIPPFSKEQIFDALERDCRREINGQAAESCGGILGVARDMAEGGWFKNLENAAREICLVKDKGEMAEVALRYGDTAQKNELLNCVQINFFNALKEKQQGISLSETAKRYEIPALIYAVESVNKAFSEVKFNAYFQGLLYDLMLRIGEENDKWSKLQE